MTQPSTNEFLLASHNQSDDSSGERRGRQYEQMGVLDDQGRKSVEDGASASHGERAERRTRPQGLAYQLVKRAPKSVSHQDTSEGLPSGGGPSLSVSKMS